MKILLGECVPRRFSESLSSGEHECLTVPEAGFAEKTNGELLSLAEGRFGAFVTLDKGLAYQQNLTSRRIGLILIRAKSASFGRSAAARNGLPPGHCADQAWRDYPDRQSIIDGFFTESELRSPVHST